ncbi:folB domain protein [Ehrlichia chaffeensis str. Heartland]|uniref:dihydroneopterin aldolase n=1 Tax=Ehrlichia chaffeensis (strain ATCC CRL-10679 / Arkansas) TaxID=205920 RepID=Q2GGI1_EHRCR|nr:dihydroneopterin aldolase [Ehrlichia chaffeensis]ABD44765.1 dihydroneopterin aldolase [Ehrlichia chaffeensis str. Arkansas]AHX03723.1 folB domain protein [Ehrlichia chaffeensis str. Heartland]AHX05556.1 folB domain protein [Ehrlichia chaffeensis str. Jax]AHX06546.1 folB domain protein [Ehrlichia chaffeensis str. Liberty]AHX07371.1 folB domain protein [Ehrlichia chaffeensis str. Osceola]
MKIQIHGFTVYSYIGVRCWEKVIKQKIIIDCDLTLCCNDLIYDIDETVDYSIFTDNLINFVNSRRFLLLETMASDLLAYIMTNEKIYHCYLKLYKPLTCGTNGNISVVLETTKSNS